MALIVGVGGCVAAIIFWIVIEHIAGLRDAEASDRYIEHDPD